MGLIDRRGRELGRLLLSAAISAAMIGLGLVGLFVTAYPRWVSLTVEPLSLLLTPGVGYSLLFSKEHDYTQGEILGGAFVFYVVPLYVVLLWRDGRAWRGISGTR